MRESVRIAFLDVAIRFQFIFFKCVLPFGIALVIYKIAILDIPSSVYSYEASYLGFITRKAGINHVNYSINYGKLFYASNISEFVAYVA